LATYKTGDIRLDFIKSFVVIVVEDHAPENWVFKQQFKISHEKNIHTDQTFRRINGSSIPLTIS